LRFFFCRTLKRAYPIEEVPYPKAPRRLPAILLARYTHRVAISNHRIANLADDKVTFRWKDYAHKSKKRLMTVSAEEFLRRFLLHTLPRGFVRIRFCGFLANRRRRELLPLCRRLLNVCPLPPSPTPTASESDRSCGWLCPLCGGTMTVIEKLTCGSRKS
jgi:hypothetical protein